MSYQYIHWSVVKLSMAYLLSTTESFLSCSPIGSYQLWTAIFNILITLFKHSVQ